MNKCNEMERLVPWCENKKADQIWDLYLLLLEHKGSITAVGIRAELDIKSYKRFKKLIRPLINCGFVSQRISCILFTNRDYWIYEITPLGKDYYNAMIDLVLPKGVA